VRGLSRRTCAASSRKWTASTPVSASTLKKKPPSQIDGAIYETAYFQPIREGCEIFFIPELEGC
jgi:hypothetical protein